MINIAIDGSSCCGKSSLAKMLAQKLGYKVFDTGALYRCVACYWLECGGGEPTQKSISKFIRGCTFDVKFIDGQQHTYACGKDYTSMLRKEEVSVMSSKVSPFKEVRDAVREIQQNFAKNNNVVMEGRDIATEVLPNADYKFFLTANDEVRARRRFAQLGPDAGVTYEQVLKDLKERDKRDMEREISPLKPAEDSIIIDNSFQTIDQSLETMLGYIKKKNKKK